MKRIHLISTSILLILSVRYVQAQRPGAIAKFDFPFTGTCSMTDEANCIDSIITERDGKIGIGLPPPYQPVATLDVLGDVNLTGDITKGGLQFISTFGMNNAFFGVFAGNTHMDGTDNTAVGFTALRSNSLGSFNTAIGSTALNQNAYGNQNTANGFAALSSNSLGSGNTASGYQALYSNLNGNFNTASGYQALYSNNNTADENSGIYNTASGYQALYTNTSGNANAAIGSLALYSTTTGYGNAASGFWALYNNTAGYYNTATGLGALISNTTGSNNTAIGGGANVSRGDLTNATAIGSGAIVNASNKIRLGDTAVTVIEGQVPYTYPSDKNKKENFEPVDGEAVLNKISGLGLTTWNYIGHNPQQFRHYGPVAQEFFEAFGHDGVGTIGTPTTINSGDLEGILMIAVQALEKRTAENAELKTRLEALERLVKDIQAANQQ